MVNDCNRITHPKTGHGSDEKRRFSTFEQARCWVAPRMMGGGISCSPCGSSPCTGGRLAAELARQRPFRADNARTRATAAI
jgi:hypothetical protein